MRSRTTVTFRNSAQQACFLPILKRKFSKAEILSAQDIYTILVKARKKNISVDFCCFIIICNCPTAVDYGLLIYINILAE